MTETESTETSTESRPTDDGPSNFIRNIIIEDVKSGKHGGRVQTRFPPEPNGYLHIGHAKAICLDFGLAAEFGGKCNLRFDDTNPSKEETEYVHAIMEDVQWLGFQWDGLFYASDYFQQLYDWAVQLIKAEKAYVCDLSADEVRQYRGTLTEPGKESPYRNRSVEANLDLFERMKKGEFPDSAPDRIGHLPPMNDFFLRPPRRHTFNLDFGAERDEPLAPPVFIYACVCYDPIKPCRKFRVMAKLPDARKEF